VQAGHVVLFEEDERFVGDVGKVDRGGRGGGVRLGEGEQEVLGG
jgi:hypothetical protein